MRGSLLCPNSVLRVLVIGGECCPSASTLQSWKANGNKTQLINIYGVTEVSCWASWYKVTESDLQLSHFIANQTCNTTVTGSCCIRYYHNTE